MTKTIVTVTSCATLLWAGVALATPTAQQQCDSARIGAWAKYVSCVDAEIGKFTKGQFIPDDSVAFARCRHAYFKHWTAFQSKASLATSTCIGGRFTDNGTTVTDNLTGLVWEKKDNFDGTGNYADPHVQLGTSGKATLSAGLTTPSSVTLPFSNQPANTAGAKVRNPTVNGQ